MPAPVTSGKKGRARGAQRREHGLGAWDHPPPAACLGQRCPHSACLASAAGASTGQALGTVCPSPALQASPDLPPCSLGLGKPVSLGQPSSPHMRGGHDLVRPPGQGLHPRGTEGASPHWSGCSLGLLPGHSSFPGRWGTPARASPSAAVPVVTLNLSWALSPLEGPGSEAHVLV